MSQEFDDLYGSQYLAATDLKKPFAAVIEGVEQQDFARQGERQRIKAVLQLKGVRKPLILNKTNALCLAEEFGKNFEDWVGKRVAVKAEDTTFQGKRTKGLRLYPANGQDTPLLKAAKPKEDDFGDSIDF